MNALKDAAKKQGQLEEDFSDKQPNAVSPDEENEEKPETPTEMLIPTYAMIFPSTMSTGIQNNIWMKKMKPEDLKINYQLAFSQWMAIYNDLAACSLVYVIPSGGNFQDLVYVSNMFCILPHMKKPTVVLSKYSSPPRKGEEYIGLPWFELWNKMSPNKRYDIHMCPQRFEGFAELKWIGGNVYIGGYGERSSTKAYTWMAHMFDMSIIPVEETDDKLYHLDCSIFHLTPHKTIVCTEVLKPSEVKEIEQYTEIIDVSKKHAHMGITNSVRVKNMVMCGSELPTMKTTDKDYKDARDTVEKLTDICRDNGMEPRFVNISEYYKSGAALSCCINPLNMADYQKEVI